MRLKTIKKGKVMGIKQDIIKRLDKKIDANKNMIADNISYLQEALNEIESSMNMISYLSFLKEDLIKNDEG